MPFESKSDSEVCRKTTGGDARLIDIALSMLLHKHTSGPEPSSSTDYIKCCDITADSNHFSRTGFAPLSLLILESHTSSISYLIRSFFHRHRYFAPKNSLSLTTSRSVQRVLKIFYRDRFPDYYELFTFTSLTILACPFIHLLSSRFRSSLPF